MLPESERWQLPEGSAPRCPCVSIRPTESDARLSAKVNEIYDKVSYLAVKIVRVQPQQHIV